MLIFWRTLNFFSRFSYMKFKISRAKGQKFSSGLRGFFKYRDLGINDATSGDFGANVIKATEGEHSKGEWHYHKLKFQMVYIFENGVGRLCNSPSLKAV